MLQFAIRSLFFFFNDTATTEIYTLSLHDALPILADLAMGEPSDRIFHEGTPIEPQAEKAARGAIDRLVLNGPRIRPVVPCNSMIYCNSLGPPARSVQHPAPGARGNASGIARYIRRGLDPWSKVQ